MSGTQRHSSTSEETGVGQMGYYADPRVRDLGPRLKRASRQFIKYSLVGASGYVVNMAVFIFMVKVAGMHYMAASVISFFPAVTNNFILNKYWTFNNPDGVFSRQAWRFLVVSLVSLGLNLVLLRVLMEVLGSFSSLNIHDQAIIAQATAITICTILNFSGNKLWSFRQASTS